MSTGTEPETQQQTSARGTRSRGCAAVGREEGAASCRRGRPGGSSPRTVVVVGGGLLLAGRGIGLAVVATAVVYALAVYLISRVVEGPRKATDRLVTVLVTTAFLIAMVPLVSVIVDGAGQRHRPVRRRSSSPTRCAGSSVRAVAATTPSSAP